MIKSAKSTSLLFIFIFAFHSSLIAAEEVPLEASSSCSSHMQENFSNYLTFLSDLENSLIQMTWQFEKYRETVYNPLWEYSKSLNDKTTPTVYSKAKVLYDHYDGMAQIYLSNAKEHSEELTKTLDSFEAEFTNIQTHCPIPQFFDCLTPWADKTVEVLTDLRKLLQKRILQEMQLNDEVQESLKDSESAHDSYALRTLPVFEKWHKEFTPKFQSLLRTLRAQIELDWPANHCCAICSQTNLTKNNIYKFDKVRGKELL